MLVKLLVYKYIQAGQYEREIISRLNHCAFHNITHATVLRAEPSVGKSFVLSLPGEENADNPFMIVVKDNTFFTIAE